MIARLIRRTFWTAFFAVFLVFTGLETVFRLFDTLNHEHADYSAYEIMLVTASALPSRLYDHLALIILIAAALGFGALSKTSEITIIRAAGVSRKRLVAMVVAALSPVLLASIILVQFGIPHAEQLHLRLVDQPDAVSTAHRLWTRQAGAYVAYDVTPAGRVVSRTALQPDTESNTFKSVIVSGAGDADLEGRVTFQANRLMTFQDAFISSHETTQVVIDATEYQRLQWMGTEPRALPVTALWNASTYLKSENLNFRHHEQLFWARILLPVNLILMIAVAAAYSVGSTRQVDMGQRVFTSVLVGLIYKYCSDLVAFTVYLLTWPPILAPLVPVAGVLLALVVWDQRDRFRVSRPSVA